jgi:hypothetical protein
LHLWREHAGASLPVDGHASGEVQSGILTEEKPKADGLLLMDIAIINKIEASKIFRIHFLFIDVPPMFGL